MSSITLSPLADYLLTAFTKEEKEQEEKKLSVNPIVSEVATWYERLRNAMDFREDEVVLRASIERILRRRLILGGDGQKIAYPLVRELLWARYFPQNSVPESLVNEVADRIDLYLLLQEQIIDKHGMDESKLKEFLYQVLSSDIEKVLNPKKEKELLTNFMFAVMKQIVEIKDDTVETKDAQVFIAVRKAFAKDDLAFLGYYLFELYFGKLTISNLESVAVRFMKGYHEIQRELSYPLKDKIFSFVRQQTPVFFILYDLLRKYRSQSKDLFTNEQELSKAVFEDCTSRYKSIGSKVRRAVIRSVIFILFTKVLFAFGVEGTYERLFLHQIYWSSIFINTSIPPLLMIMVGILIQTPGQENSKRILQRMQIVLFDKDPKIVPPLVISKQAKVKTKLDLVFTLLWLLAFIVSFGGIWFLLGKLHFNYVSRFVFIFFVTVVSFLAYRINQTAHMYSVEEKLGLITPLVDFFFLPIIQVGRRLTEGVAQVNIVLFVFDFLIETPFKGLFAFFEQWFVFLHQKREELE